MSQTQPLTSLRAGAWSIDELLTHVREGRLCIPVFQRHFRWDRQDIANLFDSLYRGYPVGNLLVWETDDKPEWTVRAEFGPLYFPPQEHGKLLIIDGQQRITTLAATMLGGGDNDSRFRLFFDLSDGNFKHAKPHNEPPSTWLPLSEVADTVRFLEWLQKKQLPPEHVRSANQLVRALRDYKLPIYLVRGDNEEQIREIFRRLNTTGKALREAEIFNALHGGREKSQLAEIRKFTEDQHFGSLDDTWTLKALSATLGLDSPKTVGKVYAEMKVEAQTDALRATGDRKSVV